MANFYIDSNRVPDYFVWIKTPQKQYVHVLGKYTLLDYVVVENDIGSLTLIIDDNATIPDVLASIGKGWIFEVQEKILGQLPTIDLNTVFIVNKVNRAYSQTGIVYTFSAEGANSILKSRRIQYRSSLPQTSKTGIASTLIFEASNENLGQAADNSARIIGGKINAKFFEIAVDPLKGSTITPKNMSMKNLLTFIQGVVDQSSALGIPIYFKVVRINQFLLQLQISAFFSGTDHGLGSGQEIVLSDDMGTLVDVEISDDDTQSFNVNTVGGAGLTVNRLFGLASNQDEINIGPYAQVEFYNESRREDDQTVLNALALQNLEFGRTRTILQGTIPTYGAVKWQTLSLGDRIVAGAGGVTYDARISAMRNIVKSNDVVRIIGMRVN